MMRTEVINRIINKYKYESYLEIGVRDPNTNFNKIIIKTKDGVDPAGKCNYVMTSDEFFSKNRKFYDIIFIDGLHLDFQVLRDIKNSLNVLNHNGTIVCHDCNPIDIKHQVPEYTGGTWNGTTWKAIATLRTTIGLTEDIQICVVDTDHGCGIIRRGIQIPFKGIAPRELDYAFLDKNRKDILNLISIKEFENWLLT